MRKLVFLAFLLVTSQAQAEQITVPFSFDALQFFPRPTFQVPTIPGHLDSIAVDAKITWGFALDATNSKTSFHPMFESVFSIQTPSKVSPTIQFAWGNAFNVFQGIDLPQGNRFISPQITDTYSFVYTAADLSQLKNLGQWQPMVDMNGQGLSWITGGSVAGSITYAYTVPEPGAFQLATWGAVGLILAAWASRTARNTTQARRSPQNAS